MQRINMDSSNIALVAKEYLLERCNNRKLLIYGIGSETSELSDFLSTCNLNVEYYIDEEPMKNFEGKTVRSYFDIVYENPNHIFIIVAKENECYGISRQKFIQLGLIEDVNFTYYKDAPSHIEPLYYDVTLGYSRIKDEIEGFEIFGDIDNPEALVIVALGGSTTESSYNFIKGWVQYLMECFIENGDSVIMYCGGVVGYTSFQELLKLIRDVIPLRPNVVLSYNGFNDLLYYPLEKCPPEKSERESGPFAYQPERVRKPFVHHFQVDFMRDVLQSYSNAEHTIYYGLQNNRTASEFWLDNIKMMNVIANEFDILFLSFLQPFFHVGEYKLTDSQRTIFNRKWWNADRPNPDLYTEERLTFIIDEARKMITAIKDVNYITDLTHIFNEYTNIYNDICHVTECGNEIIAKNIYQKLKLHL